MERVHGHPAPSEGLKPPQLGYEGSTPSRSSSPIMGRRMGTHRLKGASRHARKRGFDSLPLHFFTTDNVAQCNSPVTVVAGRGPDSR